MVSRMNNIIYILLENCGKYWQYWQYRYWYYRVYIVADTTKSNTIFVINISISQYLKPCLLLLLYNNIDNVQRWKKETRSCFLIIYYQRRLIFSPRTVALLSFWEKLYYNIKYNQGDKPVLAMVLAQFTASLRFVVLMHGMPRPPSHSVLWIIAPEDPNWHHHIFC